MARTLNHASVPQIRDYNVDFAGWSEDTARAIREGRWSEIDSAALADEVESLGRRDRREIESRFTTLFVHLLKLRYQPERSSRSWAVTIVRARDKLQKLFKESPSLSTPDELKRAMADAYASARRAAAAETGLELERFPVELPFAEVEITGEPKRDNLAF